MLRVLFMCIPFLLIACSRDRPAPSAPAGKAQAALDTGRTLRSRLKTIFFHLICLSSKWIMAI